MSNSKAWTCYDCGSTSLSNPSIVRGRVGKWIAQATCKRCGTVTRYTKNGSYPYKRMANQVLKTFPGSRIVARLKKEKR